MQCDRKEVSLWTYSPSVEALSYLGSEGVNSYIGGPRWSDESAVAQRAGTYCTDPFTVGVKKGGCVKAKGAQQRLS